MLKINIEELYKRHRKPRKNSENPQTETKESRQYLWDKNIETKDSANQRAHRGK